MRIFKFLLSLSVTGTLIFLLDNSWPLGHIRIPPMGKLLDPFHGFWHNIEPRDYRMSQTLSIQGLNNNVTVVYDSLLIPHVFASNNEDLYLAQGYITAQHRLWQMEFMTHAAAGRISELIGAGKDSVILNYDRHQRRLGMVIGAQRFMAQVEKDPTVKLEIEKYADGINQYIQSLHYEDLPLEYKLMDYTPELWTSLKTGLLLKSMAQMLNLSEKDVQMTNALKLFGKDTVALLYPDREPVSDPVVDNPNGWKFKPVQLPNSSLALPQEFIKVTQLTAPDPTIGSNNWAVHGSKTATGAPILCNDPHLDLNLPNMWYLIQLHGPEVNTMGASLPGSPGVIIGVNDSIAWGMSNAQRDLVDWYKITFKDENKNFYLLDSSWVASEKVVEKITIRDGGVSYDTVLYTHWGPVLYDENFRNQSNLRNYALRWIAHDESEELVAFHKLNRARNHTEYMEALNHFNSPSQNFVFASVANDVAMRIQGKFPVRRPLEGKFTLDGSRTENGWQAFIPNDQNAAIKNPPRGFVSSANQYPVDETYPYYINGRSFEAYRNRRINSLLSSDSSLTVEDMMRIQNDNYNLKAAESLPTFLSYLDSTALTDDERTAFIILKSWNLENDIESEGASYYEAWWDNLMPLVWDEMERKDMALAMPTTFNTIMLIKTQPNLSFFDLQNTPEKENARDVVRKAFTRSVKEIIEWKRARQFKPDDLRTLPRAIKVRWADYKDTYIDHLARITPLGFHVQHGGNHEIINATSHRHGPAWRMIVSLEKNGVKLFGVYPGGQSGNPGSHYYNNLLDYWTKGKYFALPFLHVPDVNTNFYSTTQLTPLKP